MKDDDEIGAELEAQHFDPAQRSRGMLLRAVGGELGFRTRLLGRFNVAAAGLCFFRLSLIRRALGVGSGVVDHTNKRVFLVLPAGDAGDLECLVEYIIAVSTISIAVIDNQTN